ncbi:MAG: MBL fold metallo-hydrolase [Eubacteriales bacterium]|jgi:phosphoribosyl 1,2-cyclic phosphodiesterase|nr:MBL fold metallo-hydrolase [Eubacteriales bacterium]MDD4682201.1 MBL fold metallo-hydrolase [Eubacteriales bacterium]
MATRVCALRSGSSGNAVFVENGSTSILIDAGVNGITIERALHDLEYDPRDLSAVLITHEHSDHIAGVGVLARRYKLPIYVNMETYAAMYDQIGKVDPDLINIVVPEQEYAFGDLAFTSFDISHDTVRPVGYRIRTDHGDVAVCTDTGEISSGLLDNLKGCRAVFIEANYDEDMLEQGAYPYFLKKRISGNRGHLSNRDSAEAIRHLINAGTEKFVLSHLSKDNNIPELAALTVKHYLRETGISYDHDAQISIASRYSTSCPLVLE